ncbi:MAG: hypothetical protein WCO56_20250 [Verrucomicrobiota bacterium]
MNPLLRRPIIILACFCFLPGLFAATEEAMPVVQIFDTGQAASAPLTPEVVSRRDQWTALPEDKTQHKFKGDVVVSNGRLALVLRKKGRGAEVYSLATAGAILRAELVATGNALAQSFSAVKIVENNPGTVSLDATFKSANGESLVIGYELRVGQVFIQTQPRSVVAGLRVLAPCRFAVLPDFFADDMVVDATRIKVAETELPSENFLLHMVGQGNAIVMAVWYPGQEDCRISMSGEGASRMITGSDIRYGKDGKVSVAILSAPGIWHMRDIASSETNQILHLNWKAPYAAHWRVDWQRDDQLIDSWEMLTQKPSGEYIKHGWYGQPESFGNVDWLKDNRKRWTTVLGSFHYPCWVDKDGEGYLQPLAKVVRFEGPALVYPITRLDSTPLTEFTIVDIMRATLGIGPCEYVLDIEGQKKTYQGRPTCASRTILDNIYGKKEQKEKREELLRTLDEVIAFVRHIRGRIEEYVAFGSSLDQYLETQKQAQPTLAETLAGMQATIRKIETSKARRTEGIKTPEFATQLVSDFRANMVDYEGEDALQRCKKTTAALVGIGGNQDELVGECRLAVKILRQQASMAMATDPRLAPIAKEIRRRTQQMLRNPTSYESPRH